MTNAKLLKLATFADICKAENKNESDYDVSTGKNAEEKAFICLRRLKLICKPFNGDKKPNLADTSQPKHYPWAWVEPETDVDRPFGFRFSFNVCDYGDADSTLGARPYLLDSSYVKHVFETFRSEFEQWMYWENMSFQEQ